MTWLADFTHHTLYDDGMQDQATSILAALTKQNYSALRISLTAVAQMPTKHIQAVDGAAVAARIERYVGFLNWYAAQVGSDRSLYPINYHDAVVIGVAVATGNAYSIHDAIDPLYYSRDRAPEEILRLMKLAWTEGLKMTEPYPEPKPAAGTPAA